MAAPTPLTMERLAEKDELIVAQSTSQCCRCACFQPSINWVLAEGDNFEPGTNPFDLKDVGWIHEESSWCGRTWSCCLPGCRAQKYVQHSGPAPASIRGENQGWFQCQTGEIPDGLEDADRNANVVATHEKECSCGHCWMFPIPIPICNFCPLPYLETKSPDGKVLGKTLYVCDACCFVPKYDVYKSEEEAPLYRIRPDTCVGGLCVQCRCDGQKGKCFRIPFYVRKHADPNMEAIDGAREGFKAVIDNLWSGWKHECCTQKNAYHVVFPKDADAEDKLLLLGSTVLVDVTMFEQDDNNDN